MNFQEMKKFVSEQNPKYLDGYPQAYDDELVLYFEDSNCRQMIIVTIDCAGDVRVVIFPKDSRDDVTWNEEEFSEFGQIWRSIQDIVKKIGNKFFSTAI